MRADDRTASRVTSSDEKKNHDRSLRIVFFSVSDAAGLTEDTKIQCTVLKIPGNPGHTVTSKCLALTRRSKIR